MIAEASSLNGPSPKEIARMLLKTDIDGYQALPIAQRMDKYGAHNIESFLFNTSCYTDNIPMRSPLGLLVNYVQELAMTPADARITPAEFRNGVAALRKTVAAFEEAEKTPWLSDTAIKAYLLVKAQSAVKQCWEGLHQEPPATDASANLPEPIRVAIGMAESEADLEPIAQSLMKHPKFIGSTPISKEYLDAVGDKLKAAQEEARVSGNVYRTILDAAVNIAQKQGINVNQHGMGGG